MVRTVHTRTLTSLTVLALTATCTFRSPAQELTGNLRVHDPSSILQCGNSWWLFYTGPGIRSKFTTNLTLWAQGATVFTNPPAWTREAVPANRGDFWAPDLILINGQYHLYYSVSSWGSQHSAIGLATNPTLDPADPAFHWTDRGCVIRSSTNTTFNAIDPALFLDHDQSLWMTFGSFWSGIQLVQLDPRTGLLLDPSRIPRRIAWNESIEAPFLTRRGNWFYLLVNWDACCRGIDSRYNIRMGRSASVAGPYLDREGHDMADGGGTLLLETNGRYIGPGHASLLTQTNQDWLAFHYYDGEDRGRPKLMLRKLSWQDGWPSLP